jgi:hypothetical protein
LIQTLYWVTASRQIDRKSGLFTLGKLKRFLFLFSVCLGCSLLYTCASSAEGFGRFGYAKVAKLPGFVIDSEGVKCLAQGSDKILFSAPIKQWSRVVTQPTHQIVVTEGGPGRPKKLRFDLLDIGVLMYFEEGMELRMKTVGAPYLTFESGSITCDNNSSAPAPANSWIALSFRDKQPPFVLGFVGTPPECEISGELGDWVLKTSKNYKGWVRLALPLGLESLQATTAASLGKIAQKCAASKALWSDKVADTPDPEIEDDGLGITVTFSLPRPQCPIPPAFVMAGTGGYPVKILSEYTRYGADTNEGPIMLTKAGQLVVRFPVRRIPSGRGISLGEPIPRQAEDPTWQDPIKMVDLALANTLSGRNRGIASLAKELLSSYYEGVKEEVEPASKLRVFYSENGDGLLKAAVHGLLNQTVKSAESEPSADDPDLVSIAWRFDPYGGSLGVLGDEARRTLAIAAIASCFSSSSQMRYQAALFQCGLSAERGLAVWKRRAGDITAPNVWIEPLVGIRKGLFSLTANAPVDPILRGWNSDIRCYGDSPVWIEQAANGYEIRWTTRDSSPGTMVFETGYEIGMSKTSNLASFLVESTPGRTLVNFRPESPGLCSAAITAPSWIEGFPLTVLPTTYSENVL